MCPVRGVAGGWRDCWDDPDDHAELLLAELTDTEAMAAEDAAVEAALRELQVAEAAATQARTAYQGARGAQKFRADRIKTQREELARAQGAIRSAMALREKEATERSTQAGA